jgi:hypothetical protein
MKLNRALTLCVLAGAASSASAQVVLNEIFANPPGSGSAGDDRWEYIEIQGPAGYDLSGYMIASVFGGADPNGNDIPGPLPAGFDVGDDLCEIDEAWTLDGRQIGSNGFFVLYNNNGAPSRASFIPALLPTATNSATFAQCHIPTTDTAGRIKNDGSATFILLRKRPNHTLNASGLSVYGPGYAWRKDVNQDVDFDGQIDFGGEGTLLSGGPRPAESPINSENAGTPPVGAPSRLESYQMIDDLAWSNAGGKEYSRSKQQELTDTPGFNPDAASRVAYYGSNPLRGSVFDGVAMSDSRMADEEWFYGDIPAVPSLVYDATLSGGPTDQNGPTYNASGVLDPNGTFLLNDVSRVGFRMTPGTFNDVDSSGSGGANIVQSRFVPGDFNFDGVVDCDDLALIASSVGASLDATEDRIDGNGTPAPEDDFTIVSYTYQGREFNGLLAMIRMSLSDGTTGEWNSGLTVTTADLAAFESIFSGPCTPDCPADFNGDGFVDFFDYDDFVACFEGAGTPGCDADFNGDGFVDFFDYDDFVLAFETGC